MSFPESQYDVVLLYPPAEIVREQWDEPNFPAIGIAYIGSYLEQQGGITPALIDGRLSRFSVQDTIEQIVSLKPKILGIGAMTHMVLTAEKIIVEVKKAIPDIKIVLGSFHASFLPERTMQEFPSVDFIVVGEGEMAFLDLVNSLLNNKDYENIKGVGFRKEGRVIINGSADVPETLDELGEPGWHLFDQEIIHRYVTLFPVMGQRGCPFDCNFCSRPYGKLVRQRTPKLILDEIQKNSERYNINIMRFEDETFSVDRRHTMELCQEFIKRKASVNVTWSCLMHANTIDEELIDQMKEAGCDYIGFGVESGDEEIIKNMKKGVTKKRIIRARRLLKEGGVTTLAFFIIGHPHETRQSIWNSIKFMIKLNADETAIGILVPYPGTETWELARQGQGGYKKLSDNWSDYNKQIGNAVELQGISRKEMEFYQLLGYFLVYFLNFRFVTMSKQVFKQSSLISEIISKIIRSFFYPQKT
jgi:anaerobic magnesium-protoporphyrin IX monomethyl ester cyclase